MDVYADIYDASGNRLGAGMLRVRSASVTRLLDGGGSFNVSFAGTDQRALDLLAAEREIRLYVDDPALNARREIGRGIIKTVGQTVSAGGVQLVARGPDVFEALKRTNTLLGRKYVTQSINDIIDDLLGLAPGSWSRSGSDTTSVSTRFDGLSVLKSIRNLLKENDLHFRQGTGNVLEIGSFGVPNGVQVVQAADTVPGLYQNDDVVLIDSIRITEESRELCNHIIPVGAGEGEAKLTLEYSDRTTPYTIQTETVDAVVNYSIEDATSIAAYGRHTKVVEFPNIGAISNGETARTAGSNVLYDAAVAYLRLHKDVLEVLSLTVRKPQQTLKPGDKIKVRYTGWVDSNTADGYGPATGGGLSIYRDINAEYFIMKVTEAWNNDGGAVLLDVSSIDRLPLDDAEIVAELLESSQIRATAPQSGISESEFVVRRQVDANVSAQFNVDVRDAVYAVYGVFLRISTFSYSTPSATAAAGGGVSSTTASGGGVSTTSAGGGDHNHRMFIHTTVTPPPQSAKLYYARTSNGSSYPIEMTTPSTLDLYTYDSSGDHTHSITIANHTHSITIAPHTHNLTFGGLQTDTEKPDTMSISINGTDRTAALGGPWDAPGNGISALELDITEYIEGASGGYQQLHNIVLSFAGGRGDVEINVVRYMGIQSIRAL